MYDRAKQSIFWLAVVLALTAAACGGGQGAPPAPPTGGGDGGGTTPNNPCAAALEAGIPAGAYGIVAQQGAARQTRSPLDEGDPQGGAIEAMWIHQAASARHRGGPPLLQPIAPAAGADVGDVAVLQDQGDLVLPPAIFDLAGTGLRFTPNGAGYSVATIDGDFRAALGTRVELADEDSVEIDVPFAFTFYGAARKTAFVNSDGNITFGDAERSGRGRGLAQLLTGPARVAPLLGDLDPSMGGMVFVNAAADQYTVTWCGAREVDSPKTATAQATLLPGGSIEFKFGVGQLVNAVVGLSPGRTRDFTPMDLSVPSPGSGAGAIGERFGDAILDTVAAASAFYATHPDTYDQLVVWTDDLLAGVGAVAFEDTVANDVKGINQDLFDASRDFGSAGRLQSVVMMDSLGKYPDDPEQKVFDENTTLSLLAHETGHRWLAFLKLRDRTGAISDALLGQDLAHWSFFFDSDASVMQGNDIEDLGGGRFRTVDAVKRYSRLDQYAMGLVPASAVPPMFYVESPVSDHTSADAPQFGVAFAGTRRDFLMDDVMAANGPRVPAAADAPHTWRQAFIYVVSKGKPMDAAAVAKVDRIRRAWTEFFHAATEDRMTSITTLR